MDATEPAYKKFKKAIPKEDTFKTDQKAVVKPRLAYGKFCETQTSYTRESPAWHKNDINIIRAFVNEKMQREPSEEEMEQFIRTIHGKESKKAYRAWWKSTERLVETESHLFLNNHPISLKFRPLPYEDGEAEHRSIVKGVYSARMKLWDQTYFSCIVSPEWVEDWFTPEAIAIVQRCAKQMNTDMTGNEDYGYIDVDMEEAPLFKNKEIYSLRYMPKKIKTHANGKQEVLHEKWSGLVEGNNGEVLKTTVDKDWIRENFNKSFITFMKNLQNGETGYCMIPEGDNEQKDVISANIPTNVPKAIFRQDIRADIRGCVVLSTANALHHSGYPKFAHSLANHVIQNSEAQYKGYDLIKWMYTQDVLIDTNLRKNLLLYKIKKPRKWNPLLEAKNNVVTTISVKSDDSKRDHAIALTKEFIFDANIGHALELNQSNLDMCCSANDRVCKFVSVEYGLALKERIK